MTPAIELTDVSKAIAGTADASSPRSRARFCSAAILRDSAPQRDLPPRSPTCRSTVPRGSTYGVIGRNRLGQEHGAEARRRPSRSLLGGTVRVRRPASARSSSSAPAFIPEISGRENVYINGIMLGLTRRQVKDRFDDIVDFAELREFIDAP